MRIFAGDSLKRRRQIRVGWLKMAIFASFARYIFRSFKIVRPQYYCWPWQLSTLRLDIRADMKTSSYLYVSASFEIRKIAFAASLTVAADGKVAHVAEVI